MALDFTLNICVLFFMAITSLNVLTLTKLNCTCSKYFMRKVFLHSTPVGGAVRKSVSKLYRPNYIMWPLGSNHTFTLYCRAFHNYTRARIPASFKWTHEPKMPDTLGIEMHLPVDPLLSQTCCTTAVFPQTFLSSFTNESCEQLWWVKWYISHNRICLCTLKDVQRAICVNLYSLTSFKTWRNGPRYSCSVKTQSWV